MKEEPPAKPLSGISMYTFSLDYFLLRLFY
jgi:hypothetical protein